MRPGVFGMAWSGGNELVRWRLTAEQLEIHPLKDSGDG